MVGAPEHHDGGLFGDGGYSPHSGASFSAQARHFGATGDYWEVNGDKLVRHHVCPRTKMYSFANTSVSPINTRPP